MQIRAIGCIERTEDGSIIDPTTGYIYDPLTGLPHDPLTGLPIDLGTVGGGEGGGNQLELDCFNKFLNFIEYYKDKDNKPAEYFVLIQYLVCLMDNCNSCLNLPFTKLEDNKKCSVTFCNLDIPDVIEEEEEEEEEELPEFPDIDLGTGVDDTWVNVEPIHTDMEDTTIIEQSPVWWYHSDHLGSSSYITDILGKPVQYYEYLPFGEIMVQQSTNNIFENVYKFNGKELDEQTGYYYYGARYYDPGTSIFLSVDPLAEKFVNYNPYTYTFNNPIMFTDPTGMAGESIVVGNSVKENHVTNQALNTFAQTEEGKSFLADYAKKGDVVGGHTFGKDGKYHNKGIDISFEAKDLGDNVRGTTSSSVDGDRANIAFTINSSSKVASQDGSTYDTANSSVSNTDNIVKGILSRTITIFHETFMHGVHSTQDYLDDNTFNKSNIDLRIKNHYKNAPKHFGHAQAQFGSDASSLLFNTKGLNGIKSANSIWSSGKHYNAGQLHKMMWNFTGSYK